MKPKKHFQNLGSSVVCTVFAMALIIWFMFGMIDASRADDGLQSLGFSYDWYGVLIAPIALFYIMLLMCLGYSYWAVDEDGVRGGRLFGRKVNIPYDRIRSVKLKYAGALSIFTFPGMISTHGVCILSDGTRKIKIYYEQDGIPEIPPEISVRLEPYRKQITVDYNPN